MGKLGVGIGDDFPIDEPNEPDSANPEARAQYEAKREEWRKARAEWRKRRDEWRAKRRELREEWHRERERFRAEMCARFGDWHEHGRSDNSHEDGWLNVPMAIAILVIAAIVLIAANAAASHLYLLLGALVLGGLYFAWRRGSDRFDFHRFDEPPRLTPPV